MGIYLLLLLMGLVCCKFWCSAGQILPFCGTTEEAKSVWYWSNFKFVILLSSEHIWFCLKGYLFFFFICFGFLWSVLNFCPISGNLGVHTLFIWVSLLLLSADVESSSCPSCKVLLHILPNLSTESSSQSHLPLSTARGLILCFRKIHRNCARCYQENSKKSNFTHLVQVGWLVSDAGKGDVVPNDPLNRFGVLKLCNHDHPNIPCKTDLWGLQTTLHSNQIDGWGREIFATMRAGRCS